MSSKEVVQPELEWIQMKKEFDADKQVESPQDKFMRKFKQNPLVPIGKFTTNKEEMRA